MAKNVSNAPGSGFVKLVVALAIIGALNWGLVGFFNWNLINAIFGGASHETVGWLSRIIYAVVGLAGLGALVSFPWGEQPVRRLSERSTLGDRPTEVHP